MFKAGAALAVLIWPLFGQDSGGSSDPGSIDTLRKGLSLFNSGKYQECFEVVSPYLQQNPNSAAAHKLLGMNKYMLGYPREALTEMARAIELAPKDPDAFYYLGRLYFSTDNATAALAAFQKAIELDPTSVRAVTQLGQTYEALGRVPDAEAAYLKAIELDKNQANKSAWPYHNLGVLYLSNGRSDDSIPYFRQALACNPAFPEAKVKLAVALSNKKLSNEALKLLQEALEADPHNVEGHYRLALLLTKSGRQEEAREHFALFEKYRKP